MRNVYGDFAGDGRSAEIEFKAGGNFSHIRICEDFVHGSAWRPSIHMPKEAARIWLKVTDVRAEHLQDIDDNGILAEGLDVGCYFDELWDSTIKKYARGLYGWNANPWVWVIEFERTYQGNISSQEAAGI